MICSVPLCRRRAVARGLCGLHVQRFYAHGDPSVTLTRRTHPTLCQVPRCARPYYAVGLCKSHYDRSRRSGDPYSYVALIEAQGGRCAICRETPSGGGVEAVLHADHDHTTGEKRALLCGRCNKALGLLRDDPALAEAAAAYLRAWRAVAA